MVSSSEDLETAHPVEDVGTCIALEFSPELWENWAKRPGSKVIVEAEVDWNFCRDPEWVCMTACSPEGLISISSIKEWDGS